MATFKYLGDSFSYFRCNCFSVREEVRKFFPPIFFLLADFLFPEAKKAINYDVVCVQNSSVFSF